MLYSIYDNRCIRYSICTVFENTECGLFLNGNDELHWKRQWPNQWYWSILVTDNQWIPQPQSFGALQARQLFLKAYILQRCSNTTPAPDKQGKTTRLNDGQAEVLINAFHLCFIPVSSRSVRPLAPHLSAFLWSYYVQGWSFYPFSG